ncbi:MAG: type II toxin-antitoxin system PemK/MazF family toxin [Planctomycetaceae bacterium]
MNPKRGELYRLKPDALGRRRPIVIVSRNRLNGGHSVLAIPFYSQQLAKRVAQEWCVAFDRGDGGLDKPCVAKCDQLSLIDKLDIDLAAGPIGTFDAQQMRRLIDAVKWALEIGPD